MVLRLPRRHLLGAAFAAALGALARADPAAPRPLRLVVPGAAGSALDQYARRLVEALAQRLGQPLLIDNRPGANGVVAVDAVVGARPDGDTLLLAGLNVLAVNPALYPTRLRYDPRRDLAPVSLVATGYPLLLVHPALPAGSLAELVALGQRRAEPLRCGVPGLGSVQHLAARQFERLSGLRMTHASYASQPQVLTDLIGGHLDLAIEFPSAALPLVQAGRLRALAVLGPRRKPALPQVPTAAEQGLAEIDAGGWISLMAPAGTPPARIARLNAALHAAMAQPAFIDWVQANGSVVLPSSPEACARHVHLELVRWARLVQAAGVRLE